MNRKYTLVHCNNESVYFIPTINNITVKVSYCLQRAFKRYAINFSLSECSLEVICVLEFAAFLQQ